MILELTDDQKAWQQEVKKFAASRVAPRAAAIDTTGEFPLDLVKEAAKLGLMCVTIPTTWGGAGRDYVSYALGVEAIAKASSVLAVIASVNNSLVAEPIAEFGSDSQKQQLAAEARQRRIARRFCALGRTGRVRRRESTDRCQARRPWLHDQRPQGLGCQRRGRGSRRGVCGDAAGQPGPRDQCVSRADGYAGAHAPLVGGFTGRTRTGVHGSRAEERSGAG